MITSPVYAHIFAWLGLSTCLLAAGVDAQGTGPRRVLAHYMPWFRAEPAGGTNSPNESRWEHWGWDRGPINHDPNTLRPDGRRDIAAVDYPLIGPYDSRDPAVLEYHALTAKAAGIEGFIADWYGPGAYTDDVFGRMVATAERLGTTVAICLEEKTFFPDYAQVDTREAAMDVMADQIAYVLERYAGSTAYLRHDGRPVLFIFNHYGQGALGSHTLAPDELSTVLARFGDRMLLVRTQADPAYRDSVRAVFGWCGDAAYRKSFYRAAADLRLSGAVDYVVGCVCPGFDDTPIWGWGQGPRIDARRGTREYEDAWADVHAHQPDAVQIATWNDFQEGTTIEPTETYGFTFVNQTEQMVERYTGRPACRQDNINPYRLYRMRQRVAAAADSGLARYCGRRLDRLAQSLADGRTFALSLRIRRLESLTRRLKPPPHLTGTAESRPPEDSPGFPLPGGQNAVEPPTNRWVVAHYFNWFSTPQGRGGWRHWDWQGNGPKHDPNTIRDDGRHDIASVYYPLIGPYDSYDPHVVEYHMRTAQAAKIDGFCLDWYGLPSLENKGMPLLLAAADRLGFKLCVCFEDKAMFGYHYAPRTRAEAVENAIENLAYILRHHAIHPSYLRIDGKPVIVNFSWSEPGDGVQQGVDGFSAEEYARILDAVRQKFDVIFVHDYHAHIKASYWSVADSVYPWLDTNGDALTEFYRESDRRHAAGNLRFRSGLVYPGFDNRAVWGWGQGPTVTPREDGAFYERSWNIVQSNGVDFVHVATWNDFAEGAVIEPTVEFGFTYLEQTERLAARFKGVASDGGQHLQEAYQQYQSTRLSKPSPGRDAVEP